MEDIYKKLFVGQPNLYYNKEHYNKIINETSRGIKENGEPLFYLIKGGIKNTEEYKEILKKLGKSKTKNRGSASGVCDLKQFPKNAIELIDPKTHIKLEEDHKYVSVKYKDKNGKICGRCQSNIKRSACAGYFDNVGKLPCRAVGFSKKNPEKHKKLNELAIQIDKIFYENDKVYYNKQKELADKNKQMTFKDTIFSTMTINYDFRTACHKDRGDYKEGLSTLTILEELPENYEGFYLGLPEYKIAFNLRDGDILIFDAHEFHCNTEYKVLTDKLPIDDLTGENFAGRMAVVSYLRNRLHKCPKKFVIKTRNRVEKFRRKTYKLLMEYGIRESQLYLFVSTQKDFEDYSVAYPKANIILGDDGVAGIDNFIVDYFDEGEKYVYMNDDVSQIQKLKNEGGVLSKQKVENINDLIDEIFFELEENNLTYGGIFNVDNAMYMSKKEPITYDLTLVMDPFSCIINNKEIKITAISVPDYPEYIGDCSDGEKCILHYKSRGGIVRFNHYCMKVEYFSKDGGIEGRDKITALYCAMFIKEKYPDYVSSINVKKSGFCSLRLKRLKRIKSVS